MRILIKGGVWKNTEVCCRCLCSLRAGLRAGTDWQPHSALSGSPAVPVSIYETKVLCLRCTSCLLLITMHGPQHMPCQACQSGRLACLYKCTLAFL